jgi:hypothetical protein
LICNGWHFRPGIKDVSDAVIAECAKVIGAEHTFTANLDRVPERGRQSIKELTQGIRQAPISSNISVSAAGNSSMITATVVA